MGFNDGFFERQIHSAIGRANLLVSPKFLEGASPDVPKFYGNKPAKAD